MRDDPLGENWRGSVLLGAWRLRYASPVKRSEGEFHLATHEQRQAIMRRPDLRLA